MEMDMLVEWGKSPDLSVIFASLNSKKLSNLIRFLLSTNEIFALKKSVGEVFPGLLRSKISAKPITYHKL